MSETVTTAVIAAAGLATRMWPASKVVPKELFPLGRVPAIVHLVWELLDAGIRRIGIVVAEEPSGVRGPIEELFDRSVRAPKNVANDPLVKRFQQACRKANFTFIPQSSGYGNGIPLKLAAKLVGQSPCIYAFGDDVVFGENVSKGLLNTFARTGCPVLAAQQVEPSRRSQFGIIECCEDDGIQYISRLIEKPRRKKQTASTLASFGRYLVTPDLVDILLDTRPRNEELWFVDSVIQRIRDGKRVCAFPLSTGRWYTVGDPVSYAQAVAAAPTEYPARKGT